VNEQDDNTLSALAPIALLCFFVAAAMLAFLRLDDEAAVVFGSTWLAMGYFALAGWRRWQSAPSVSLGPRRLMLAQVLRSGL